MKYITILILLLVSSNSFAQKTRNNIQAFEKDLLQWGKSTDRTWTLQERMSFYQVNAVSIAVIKDFKVQWVKAYGYADVALGKKATSKTRFQAASISKSLNSLALIKLVQDRKIDLDKDINLYLKRWKFPYDSLSNGHKISVFNLLNHTAGLSLSGFMGYAKGESLPTLLQILDGQTPANSEPIRSIFEPNLRYQYSGGGTMISQVILEDISGVNYEDYMQQHILAPLHMKHSSFRQPPSSDKHLATGYNKEKEVPGKYHIYPEQAAAGLWTTARDLANYVIDTQLSLLGKSNKILSQEMSKQRLENNWGVFARKFTERPYFQHSGGNEGFVCHYIGSYAYGDGLVIMTNGSSAELMHEIVKRIAYLNEWKDYPIESTQ